MTATEARQQTPQHQIARLAAEVFAPAVLVATVSIVVAFASSTSLIAGILWAVVTSGFCAGIPFWFMARGARAGKWDTHHVRDRSDRLVPLAVSIGSVIVGLVLLTTGGAPGELIALVLSMLLCLAASAVITKWWKISLHAAIAAGTVAILAVTFGAWWWLGLLVALIVSWSRIVTCDHTIGQVLSGAITGAALGGSLYAILL